MASCSRVSIVNFKQVNAGWLTTSDKFLTHITPMFYFYRLKTSENHTVFKSFQKSQIETLARYGLRLICLSKYKTLVDKIR